MDTNVKDINIVEEMQKNYIDYAMSVITARALPDSKDGLKPVQRRILYSMHENNVHHNSRYSKSSRIVGAVMGSYHPHGDASIYDAMVHMAQSFSLRYRLIDGQGNFGSMDGDSAAAMRYTEARLQKLSEEILKDIDKETVEFQDNYDGRTTEPIILPSVIPNLLLNGSEGIAVGMATKIPPHNLSEVMNGLIFYLENIKEISENNDITINVHTEELMEYIKGPDFPTKGTIYDKTELLNMYSSGKGRIVIRGKAEIIEKNSRNIILISQIPFQVNKARLITKIAELVKNQKIEGISDIRDESSKGEVRIVIELKREAKPNIILNKLYKFTDLQTVFNANILALVEGEPKVLTLKDMLEIFTKHRIEIVTKRTEFELKKAKEREHILQGLKIAIDNIDEVINIIRSSKDADTAKKTLEERFKLTEIQSQAILDMQLRRLAALERQKIEDELKEILELIKRLEIILSDKFNIIKIIKEESEEIKRKYGDERLTKIVSGKVGTFETEDIIENKKTLITISNQGYIKRLSPDTYKTQHRGGKGIIGMTTKSEDYISQLLLASTLDDILFFSNKGRVFQTKVYEVPEFLRTAKGQPLVNIINLERDEIVTSVLIKNKNEMNGTKYLLMATKNGIVKKTNIEAFNNIRKNGLIAIKLDSEDELKWVMKTSGKDEIILVTKMASSIRFKEANVRETGRASRGVKGIKIKKDDVLIGADLITKDGFVLVVSENGFSKKTSESQHLVQNRGGKGVIAARINEKTGNLTSMHVISGNEEGIMVITINGQIIKLKMTSIPIHKRNTSGVKLINLTSEDKVATTEYF